MNLISKSARLVILALFVILCGAVASYARDAAFLEPGAGGAGSTEEAVKVEPKAEMDVGETNVGIAKSSSVFFVNQTNQPVKIEKIVINSDSNVTAEATANDCTKLGVIDASSRCSVEISVTPSSPGTWAVDVLMTHNGAGRITRARLTGKTTGATNSDNKVSGLTVNTKDYKPVDFGDVTVGDGKTVRTTLMINDSADPITIYSIDVIEADNGLQKLDQGCAVDMELAPGASCPVTLLWTPRENGPISTDLIIRHSGKLGFAVIPIRGVAKGSAQDAAAPGRSKTNVVGLPMPPSANDLENAIASRIPPVSSAALGGASIGGGDSDGELHLIGTVGNRALFLMPSGVASVVGMGDTFKLGKKSVKLLEVNARSAIIMDEGAKRELPLEAAASLVSQARQAAESTSYASPAPAAKTGSPSGQSVKIDAASMGGMSK